MPSVCPAMELEPPGTANFDISSHMIASISQYYLTIYVNKSNNPLRLIKILNAIAVEGLGVEARGFKKLAIVLLVFELRI